MLFRPEERASASQSPRESRRVLFPRHTAIEGGQGFTSGPDIRRIPASLHVLRCPAHAAAGEIKGGLSIVRRSPQHSHALIRQLTNVLPLPPASTSPTPPSLLRVQVTAVQHTSRLQMDLPTVPLTVSSMIGHHSRPFEKCSVTSEHPPLLLNLSCSSFTLWRPLLPTLTGRTARIASLRLRKYAACLALGSHIPPLDCTDYGTLEEAPLRL